MVANEYIGQSTDDQKQLKEQRELLKREFNNFFINNPGYAIFLLMGLFLIFLGNYYGMLLDNLILGFSVGTFLFSIGVTIIFLMMSFAFNFALTQISFQKQEKFERRFFEKNDELRREISKLKSIMGRDEQYQKYKILKSPVASDDIDKLKPLKNSNEETDDKPDLSGNSPKNGKIHLIGVYIISTVIIFFIWYFLYRFFLYPISDPILKEALIPFATGVTASIVSFGIIKQLKEITP